MNKNFVFEKITNLFIEKLESGVCPWSKPWKVSNSGGACLMARSYKTQRPYSMLNQLILGGEGEWLTFKEIQSLGGKLKKGSKSKEIYGFFKSRVVTNQEEVDNATEGEVVEPQYRDIFSFKFWSVFNAEDVENIPHHDQPTEPTEEPTADPIKVGEEAIANYVKQSGITFHSCISDSAYYRPSTDEVYVPSIKQYEVIEEYYSTTFHELVHSSGHAQRLNRVGITDPRANFGSEKYSQEELIAELGSAFILACLGIESEKAFDNSAAYLQGWANRLKEKDAVKWVAYSAVHAEKACRYILNMDEA